MKNSIKEIFESDSWKIAKILQGYNGMVRIDAETRFYVAGEDNRYSGWCTKNYADSLARENYGKNTNEFNCFSY